MSKSYDQNGHSTSFSDAEMSDFFMDYSAGLNSFAADSYCELERIDATNTVDIVRIKSNVAGRLLIEYAADHMNEEWLFYLDTRLHALGWARKNKICYANESRCWEKFVEENEKSNCFYLYYMCHLIIKTVYIVLH